MQSQKGTLPIKKRINTKPFVVGTAALLQNWEQSKKVSNIRWSLGEKYLWLPAGGTSLLPRAILLVGNETI